MDIFSAGMDFRRQILMTKVGPRAGRIKGVVNCQNSRDKGPPEGNGVRG